ncbi:MAG: GIY-YIG nuclease family protein [Selenomonadaceae bacterium]|nr:GIY-YIG nuclease family protein [Selenomonadaceae bacterium]
MKQGIIYKITDNHNGMVYIGQTVQSLKRRWKCHRSHLQCQTHHNELLQKVYNKYGFEVLSIEIIEKCDIDKLDDRERYWINYYDSTNRDKGYNFESGGNELKKHSAETKEKMTLASRGHNNKLTVEQVTEIKKQIIAGEPISEIACKFNVGQSCIYRIKILQNWAYVSPELNEQVFNTDTSRKINRLTQSEIEECKKAILDGESAFLLAQKYGISYGRFLDIFRNEVNMSKIKSKEWQKAEELCKALFFKNLSVKDILKATGLTYTQYKRLTKGLEIIRHNKMVEYVVEAKAEGKTNPVIAKELNINRCTVTVYWKEYKQKIC